MEQHRRWRPVAALLVALALLFVARSAFADDDAPATGDDSAEVVNAVPAEFREGVERGLGEAGDNRPALLSSFDELKGD